jgi:hypothetical protein
MAGDASLLFPSADTQIVDADRKFPIGIPE